MKTPKRSGLVGHRLAMQSLVPRIEIDAKEGGRGDRKRVVIKKEENSEGMNKQMKERRKMKKK